MVYRFCNFFQVSIAINPANGHKTSCKAEKTLAEKHHIKRWKRHETALKIPDKGSLRPFRSPCGRPRKNSLSLRRICNPAQLSCGFPNPQARKGFHETPCKTYIFNRYLFADYKSLYYMAGDCKSHAALIPRCINPTQHLIPRCTSPSPAALYLFEADKRTVHENQNIKEQLIFCTKCHINTLKKTYFPAKTT